MELSDWDYQTLRPAEGFVNERVRPIDLRLPTVRNPFIGFSHQQVIFPCGVGMVSDGLHSHRLIARCGLWRCRDCSALNKSIFLAKVAWVRQEHDGECWFSVLTFRSRDGEALGKNGKPISLETQKRIVRDWVGAAGEVLGTKALVKSPEPHKSGVLHWNIVWFGVERGNVSCNLKNSRGSLDMRMQCMNCTSCRLRSIWTGLSGAERSTHDQVHGNIGQYVSKYMTKDWGLTDAYDGTKRYSFSRACKTPPSVVPAYQWIIRRLQTAEVLDREITETFKEWYRDDDGVRYVVDSGEREGYEGLRLERDSCSERHGGSCDKVPYFSPTQVRAYGGHERCWARVDTAFGEGTSGIVREKLRRLLRIRYGYNRYDKLGC